MSILRGARIAALSSAAGRTVSNDSGTNAAARVPAGLGERQEGEAISD
jgi:hypothetical protein